MTLPINLDLSVRELLALRKFIEEHEPKAHWTMAENKALDRVAEKVDRLATGQVGSPQVRLDATTLEFDEGDLTLLVGACFVMIQKVRSLVGEATDGMLMETVGSLAGEMDRLMDLRGRIEMGRTELRRNSSDQG